MQQAFKSIYFPDRTAGSAKRGSLTLAFGEKDRNLYDLVKDLTSQEVRELIGHSSFPELQAAADQDGLATGTYCLRTLRQKALLICEPTVQYELPGIGSGLPFSIDPLQATFKGGQEEPLHGWYPYLEGYSPEFVEQALCRFAPQAQAILDPFAGSGTTPLTAAALGRTSYFCELNPVLQHLIEVKSAALSLSDQKRRQVRADLQDLAGSIADLIRDALPDATLSATYRIVFAASEFFDTQTFDSVLRARTVIDVLTCTVPHIADLLSVAVIASLIPSSKLIRRGDLRFRTEGETKSATSFETAVSTQLLLMAEDLRRSMHIDRRPVLACEDSRHLDKLPALDVDAVITSPPYLNGTNYFRNTKIELWFLRCLQRAGGLAAFRYRAVTAGINDVTVGKAKPISNKAVQSVVERLQASAYDSRIPLMVSCYFADMEAIIRSFKPHLTTDARVIVDIGDSAYGQIHVPTDILLTEVFDSCGFECEHETTLRKRMSRGGYPLRQRLLVFSQRTQHISYSLSRTESMKPPWVDTLLSFKVDLPHQTGDFSKRNWGHPLHSLCSYQGKMKPSLASHLVNVFVKPGDRVLDPFAGVGTIPFEAALQGAEAWAFDISPAAICISQAKLGKPDADSCHDVIELLTDFIKSNEPSNEELDSARSVHFNGPLIEYFNPATLREVLLARRYFLLYPPQNASQSLVLASLLHILHGNRPYALSRRSHPITPFAPTGPTEYRPLVPRLCEKISRGVYASYPREFKEGHAQFQDATEWWPRELDDLDAIITSPPFFDSTRFYLANWMRLWFCGWEAGDFRTKPLAFVDEKQKKTFEIYEPVFRQARERLKLGGVFVLHLGHSRKCNMADSLLKVASRWFRVADRFTERVDHCESHGIRDKGTVDEHQFLVLH